MDNLPDEIKSDIYNRISDEWKIFFSKPCQSFIDRLPVKISIDIFSRLPADTVLECGRVCKAWRCLLSLDKTDFAALHLRHNNGVGSKVSTLGLIFLGKQKATCCPLYYREFDENSTDHDEQCIQNTLRSINRPLFRTHGMYCVSSLVGSSNGLICLAEQTGMNRLQDPIHIYNPITEECLYLPGFNKNNRKIDLIYSGFGCIPQTNEYKVVRILYDHYRSGRGDIQVYTLGSGIGWRNIGEITEPLSSLHGIFYNGALHWLGQTGKHIVAFNLSDEKFHGLPEGPFSEQTYKFASILGSYGEWLCVSGYNSGYIFSKCIDIWTFKKTSPGKSNAGTDNKDGSWRWCKEFSIMTPDNSFASQYRPFSVTKSGLILLKYTDRGYGLAPTLFCYDPKTATMKKYGIQNFSEVIPHTSSCVSLESLRETGCRKRKRGSFHYYSAAYYAGGTNDSKWWY